MGNWETNSKYHKEFIKLKSCTLPKGKRRRLYELRWALAFKKISFNEYSKKLKILERE